LANQRLAPILRDWFKNSSGCHDLARKMISRPARKRWQPKGSPPARPGRRRTRNAPDCARQAPSRCARSGRAPIGPGEMATREVVRLRESPWPRRRRAPPAPRRPRAADAGMQSETGSVAWRAAPSPPAPFRRALQARRKGRSRPISRVLSWTVIPLGLASPQGSSDLPGRGAGHTMTPLFGLAPGGVCRAGPLPDSRCALTAPFHPCHALPGEPFGGLLSVALSVGSRRPGVTWHRALWSPDFPRRIRRCVATVWSTPRG
jgi:hypothetical protein